MQCTISAAITIRVDSVLYRIKLWQKFGIKRPLRKEKLLGCSYRDGEGGPVDKVLAAKYFRMAAEMGHIESITNLGLA